MKQKHYSDDFKEQALAKVFGRSSDQSVDSIADGLKMSKGTLRNWMKRTLLEQSRPRVSTKQSGDWTPADRLLALQESHGLEEEALHAWCRGRGIFAHDLTQWRGDCCNALGTAGQREESEELRQLRIANQQLQRDLNRKEKALAEAAALLVLQKKYRARVTRTKNRRTCASVLQKKMRAGPSMPVGRGRHQTRQCGWGPKDLGREQLLKSQP